MVIKIQLSEFNEVNEHVIKHAFLANVPRENKNDLSNIIRKYFSDSKFTKLKQTHSNVCHIIDAGFDDFNLEGDAVVTGDSFVALCVSAADCIPILFVDSENRIIGAAHSGWRGAKSGIIKSTITKMQSIGADIGNIKVAIGPCIKQLSYEVDTKFQHDFLNDSNGNKRFFIESKGSIFFDLYAYVVDKLKFQGIEMKNIYTADIDTYSNNGIASYRRCVHHNLPYDYTNIALILLTQEKEYKNSCSNEWYDYTSSVKKTRNNKSYFTSMNDTNLEKIYPAQEDDSPADHCMNNNNSEIKYLGEYDSKQLIKKVKKGLINIESTLDLHGLTLEESFIATKDFILDNYNKGSKYLLLIAGKGKKNRGLIRASIKEWVEGDNAIASKILLFQEALPHHGGDGSFYVFLRKKV